MLLLRYYIEWIGRLFPPGGREGREDGFWGIHPQWAEFKLSGLKGIAKAINRARNAKRISLLEARAAWLTVSISRLEGFVAELGVGLHPPVIGSLVEFVLVVAAIAGDAVLLEPLLQAWDLPTKATRLGVAFLTVTTIALLTGWSIRALRRPRDVFERIVGCVALAIAAGVIVALAAYRVEAMTFAGSQPLQDAMQRFPWLVRASLIGVAIALPMFVALKVDAMEEHRLSWKAMWFRFRLWLQRKQLIYTEKALQKLSKQQEAQQDFIDAQFEATKASYWAGAERGVLDRQSPFVRLRGPIGRAVMAGALGILAPLVFYGARRIGFDGLLGAVLALGCALVAICVSVPWLPPFPGFPLVTHTRPAEHETENE